MRNRSNSGVRLDYYQRLVQKTILKHQNPATGLFPASGHTNHAWVRDNIYSILAVWALALAYRKNADLDEDRAKAYELEQAVVKLMRGLLKCMMGQVKKLERFKSSQSPKDALHAKYCSMTGKTVVGDNEWGHLQIDATSLYLLILSEMTASGLQIVYTLTEVAFVQNLVFYIETSYRTPDYGIWERGDKTNHGLPELNSSSIGMAKAALEAINELDLFGAHGGPSSIIHILPDEAQQCKAILHSMLPRESSSKEVDASLLTVISYPAFAVDDINLIAETRNLILEKLKGNYGCCRFLRDGYKTAKEDPNRLYYEPWELLVFENIECEWPLFFAFLVLDGIFNDNPEQVDQFRKALDNILVKSEDGLPLMPELYSVPADKVELEYKNPKSQSRQMLGKLPHKWGQSMFILGRLLCEGFLSPGELDPLNRRLVAEPKPDVVVQVVILAEDVIMKNKLAEHGLDVDTTDDVIPIQVHPARVLSQLYSFLGKNEQLGLNGRPSNEIGLLATSKLYIIRDQILAFMPQFLDQQQFYMVLDISFLVDFIRTEVSYLKDNWKGLGRPTLTIGIASWLLDHNNQLPNALLATIKKMKTGYIGGTRIHLGRLKDFLTTSCMTKLSFLDGSDDSLHGSDNILDSISSLASPGFGNRSHLLIGQRKVRRRKVSGTTAGMSVHGIVKRSRSIHIDPEQMPEILARMKNLESSQQADLDLDASSQFECLLEETAFDEDSSILHTPSDDDSNHSFQHLREHVTPKAIVGSPRSASWTHLETSLDSVDGIELVRMLEETDNLHEQADIIHYLYIHKGLKWETNLGGRPCTVMDLLSELYQKAGHWKQWWLVRHTAGMLKKRVEDLALAATDLIVRQKQLSVGMPSENEKHITSPLPPDELAAIIYEACGEDLSACALTQELLIYLAMFIRTEPKLFHEMLRLRVGLIIQVMASEMARTLTCTGDDASDHLLNLSPFEMKTLLHHILSGKEFSIANAPGSSIVSSGEPLVIKTERRKSIVTTSVAPSRSNGVFLDENEVSDRQGQWIRRRRLDGALNRVPVGFYPQVWKVLERCHGLSIEGHVIPQSIIREMTSGEFKFALQVEMVLNQIPQPEYRQLMVEALMVLILLVENDNHTFSMGRVIQVDQLVREANEMFLQDQSIPIDVNLTNTGAAGISHFFYDSAPSGRYGTMSYLCRALGKVLQLPIGANESVECVIN